MQSILTIEWVEKLGVDSSRVMVIRTNDAKKIFEVWLVYSIAAEKVKR